MGSSRLYTGAGRSRSSAIPLAPEHLESGPYHSLPGKIHPSGHRHFHNIGISMSRRAAKSDPMSRVPPEAAPSV